MAFLAHNRIVEGTNSVVERGELTREEARALAEATAQDLLGITADQAFRLLDSGKLDGTPVEARLKSLRWLLA